MKKAILLCISMCFAVSVTAQHTVNGTVTDASDGEPLMGVTVLVQGTNVGTTTDTNGQYEINVPQNGENLIFSFVGYQTVEELIESRSTIDVEMRLDMQLLDDVVVSGYAVIPRREITGSLSQVRGRDVDALDISSPDQALQGRIAGARVSNLSGQPGGAVHVRIRGLGSINASNDPLYIVDGVPISTVDRSGTLGSGNASNALNAINPRDIESIEVLKDAAASAIYGAQASNGVILITTKRGNQGQTQFNISSSFGVSEELKRLDLIEGPEWVELNWESFEWWGEFTNNPNWPATAEATLGYNIDDVAAGNVPHFDWQDQLIRTGTNQRYDLSASGGNEQTRFYIAGGYTDWQGTAINTGMDRLNIRANIDHTATERMSLEFNVNASRTQQSGALQDGFFSGSPFFAGQFMRPTRPIFNEDGTYADAGGYNPLAANELDTRDGTQNQLVGNVSGMYNITSNLNFRSNFGLDYRVTEDVDYRAPESPAGDSFGGYRLDANRKVVNFTTNQVFNYLNNFGGHGIRALAGFEYRQERRDTFSASGQGFPSGLFRTLQNAAEPLSVTGFGSEFRIASLLSRVQYDYEQRYLASISLRYDGSSRFGEDRRWGLFYAGSLGWTISEEDFMDFSNDWLTELKLRVSHGITGNTNGISNFASRQLFGSGGAYRNQPALTPTSLGNNILTWEEAQTTNAGFDWQMYEGRVYGSFDIYRRTNTDLLLDRELVSDSGFTSLTENAGRVRNEGIEFEVGAVLLDLGNFVWTSEFNIAFNRNELLELNEGRDRIGSTYFVGRSLTEYYMYRYAGVNPADGRPMFYDRNNNITYTPSTASTLEEDDRQFVGDSAPTAYGGLFNRFNYRGFSLDVLFQYNFGQTTYNSYIGSFTDGAFFRREGLIASSRDRWTEPGQITSVERAYVNSSYPGRTTGFTTSTRFLEDASYIRLKNMRLAYTIPVEITSRIGLRNATVHVQGTNLITWTNYTGIDPEIVGSNTGVYPQTRTLSTGIEIGF